jgi:hypothetical protein
MRYRIMWMTPTGLEGRGKLLMTRAMAERWCEVSSHLVPGCQHWIEEVPILEAFFYWMDH